MVKGRPCPNRNHCPGWHDGMPPSMTVTREQEEKMGSWVWYHCSSCDFEEKVFEAKPDWLIKMQEAEQKQAGEKKG